MVTFFWTTVYNRYLVMVHGYKDYKYRNKITNRGTENNTSPAAVAEVK